MTNPGFCSWVARTEIGSFSGSFTFAPPENQGFRPASEVLEIGPEWRRFRRPRDRDAEAETARETENLGAWGGESGRGPARASREIQRAGGGRRGRISEVQFFGERTLRKLPQAAKTDPQETLVDSGRNRK